MFVELLSFLFSAVLGVMQAFIVFFTLAGFGSIFLGIDYIHKKKYQRAVYYLSIGSLISGGSTLSSLCLCFIHPEIRSLNIILFVLGIALFLCNFFTLIFTPEPSVNDATRTTP